MKPTRLQTLLRILLAAALAVTMLPLAGCDRWFAGEEDVFDMIHRKILEFVEEGEGGEEATSEDGVEIALTHPAGASPNVFTTGWVFGARATVTEEDGGTRNLSGQVRWSGSGSFSPSQGNLSRPSFGGPGANTITLSVEVDGKTYQQDFTVNCVSPAGYAAVGDQSACAADGHGCLACPHATVGPIATGSPNVFVGGRPAARVGDRGNALPCCGPNTFEITGGDSSVLINGRPAAKVGSPTQHCGGVGEIIGGGG
jgi:uncharacterized Zn-binding protein involved in type VI secretion